MGRPTFSPSFLLLDGADDGDECVESELEVESRVKMGPAKTSGSLPSWSTMRLRVMLAVGWPMSQAELMLRKTDPSKLVALRDASMSAVAGESRPVASTL